MFLGTRDDVKPFVGRARADCCKLDYGKEAIGDLEIWISLLLSITFGVLRKRARAGQPEADCGETRLYDSR